MIASRTARSLETKWGSIKHVASKFHGIYQIVKDLSESGRSEELIICEFLALYQLKHPKDSNFAFEHCWIILWDMPHWAELRNGSVRTLDSLTRNLFDDALGALTD